MEIGGVRGGFDGVDGCRWRNSVQLVENDVFADGVLRYDNLELKYLISIS